MYAIKVQNVSKTFRSRKRYRQSTTMKSAFLHLLKGQRIFEKEKDFVALDGVSFDVPKGIMLGIIGSNGSGKSTLMKLMAGIHRPNSGGISTNGRISALIELGAGFHPEFTGRQNAFMAGQLLGHSTATIAQHFAEIETFAEIGDYRLPN